jgi:hypothetical protein
MRQCRAKERGNIQANVLQPRESIRPHVGLLMFEFSRFYLNDFEHGRYFVAAPDAF